MITNFKEIILYLFDLLVTGQGQQVKNKKVTSSIYYVLIIAGLVGGYQVALKAYLEYNFFQNEGIVIRALKITPLAVGSVLLCIYFIPTIIKSISTLYWYLFIAISMIPILVVYTLNGIADSKNVILFIYVLFILVFLGIYLNNKFDVNLPYIYTNETIFLFVVIGFSLASYIYIVLTLGVPNSLITALKDVYGVRLNYRSAANRFPLDDYLVQWLGNIINPFLLAYTLRNKKNFKFAIIPIALEVLLYCYTAYKSLFVVLVLAPFFAFVLSKGIKRSFLEKSILLVVFFGVIMGYIGKYSLYLASVLRIFLWPSLIGLEYYDFFSIYPKMKLAHSVFSRFYENIYAMEPSFYMATIYCNKPAMRLNTTWYADAYMNFGFGGLFIFAIALFMLLLVIKSIEKKDIYLAAALLFGGIMELFNAPLLTTMLTHGLGMGLLLAYLLPQKREERRSRIFY